MENVKEVTIYDIAKKLNVSASTVSRALNSDATVNIKTRKKITDAATKMGYRFNLVARSLRQQSSLTLGVIVHNLNSSLMITVLSGIEKIANEAGYNIIITDSSQSGEKEMVNAANLFNRRVDGLIASLIPGTNSLQHFKPFKEKGIPVIFLDQTVPPQEGASILVDHHACGYEATKHLIGQGCRRIAHITTGLQQKNSQQKYAGLRDALKESKISFKDSWLITTEANEQAVEEAAKKVVAMKPAPDGVFVTDDFIAAVTVKTFLENGLKVPDDIAVVGFNNDIIGKLVTPTLTTINYPGKEIGEAAAKMLINKLKGIDDAGNIASVSVRADLVIRQSSLKKNA